MVSMTFRLFLCDVDKMAYSSGKCGNSLDTMFQLVRFMLNRFFDGKVADCACCQVMKVMILMMN